MLVTDIIIPRNSMKLHVHALESLFFLFAWSLILKFHNILLLRTNLSKCILFFFLPIILGPFRATGPTWVQPKPRADKITFAMIFLSLIIFWDVSQKSLSGRSRTSSLSDIETYLDLVMSFSICYKSFETRLTLSLHKNKMWLCFESEVGSKLSNEKATGNLGGEGGNIHASHWSLQVKRSHEYTSSEINCSGLCTPH